jgi:DNA-binding transcriptional LysR family regulator
VLIEHVVTLAIAARRVKPFRDHGFVDALSTIAHVSDMDGFTEIGVFARVVDARSFTAAARSLGLTPSGVSRAISRLERRLGARLLQRTTRSLSLTDDGAAYYERCKAILVELADAEAAVARASRVPRGRLRVDAPTVLARHVLAPALPRFLARYPELSLDLSVRDHLIDPIAEGVDITLRMAAVMRDTELVAKNLGALRIVVAGSPRYLAKHGRPRHPDDLADHTVIGFLSGATALPWRFRNDREVAITGRLHSNSADACRDAAVAGVGLVYIYAFHIADDLARGRLVPVLVDYERPPRPVYALYARERATSPKLRVFLDFAGELVTASSRLPR